MVHALVDDKNGKTSGIRLFISICLIISMKSQMQQGITVFDIYFEVICNNLYEISNYGIRLFLST